MNVRSLEKKSRAAKVRTSIRKVVNQIMNRFGLEIVKPRELVDFYLHEYSDYEQYRDVQVLHNKRKISIIFADESTLKLLASELRSEFPNKQLRGLCHGARNGFEQNYLRDFSGFDVTGTDISDTALDFDHSVQWDFHDVNEEWVGKFDFVYSNSLDQSWQPRAALVTWLNQLNDTGILVIEHTEQHGPRGASEMDPFGVRPTVMPYVLSEWFGFNVSIRFVKSVKDNMEIDVWLFFIKKNVPEIS